MMTNAKGDLEPSLSDGTTTTLTLYSSEIGATANPLAINLDRVTSKVRVYVTETSDSNVTISDAGWLLNVTNKKYFPVAKRTKTWNEINNGGTITWTPFDTYKLGSYRVDPNYDNQSLTDYYYYSADPGTWNASGNAEYCLENTQEKDYNVHAYTTHALIRVKYVPDSYRLPDGSSDTNQETNGDWMMISGGYYTATTLIQWIEGELKAKYLKADGTTPNSAAEAGLITTVLTTSLNSYLATTSVGAETLPASVSSASEVATLVTNFTSKLASVSALSDANKAKTVGSFTYYGSAYNYYKVMIKHDDVSGNTAVNELGEFGVVRNSVYDVNITKFNNPGYPTIPTPDPNEPDEDNDKWVSVQININPWTWYSQTEEF